MPNDKLPQAKLAEFEGQKITIKRVIHGASTYGPYALLLTADKSIITSHKVVLSQLPELEKNLPATVTVTKRDSQKPGGNPYFVLE